MRNSIAAISVLFLVFTFAAMFANKPFANASLIYHVTAAVDIHMGPATLKVLSTQFRFRSFKFADPRSDYQEETKVPKAYKVVAYASSTF